jgi:5-methylcytosine-specific restriction endonuclease McrA
MIDEGRSDAELRHPHAPRTTAPGPGVTTPMAWEGRRPGRHAFPQSTAKAILLRDQDCVLGLCGCTGQATQADHIVSWADADRLGWTMEEINDISNGAGLCANCHAIKTADESSRGLRRSVERRKARRAPPQHPGLI